MTHPVFSIEVRRRWIIASFIACAAANGAVPGAADEETPAAADRYLKNSIGTKLVRIPAGEFLMGSTDELPDVRDDERPRHKTRITRPFYLGVYEVTQGEYERVMGVNSGFFSNRGPGKAKVTGHDTSRFPAEQVAWINAAEFCRRLSAMPAERRAGRVYRLPTEAEWEYACRAGTRTTFHYGNTLNAAQANFNGKNPYGDTDQGPFLARTTKVGSYAPNAFGLYDMHGNVWEWCADWYSANYYERAPVDDPPGPQTGSARVIRGGAWYSDARDCRSAFRLADSPRGVYYVLGFRVACDVGNAVAQRAAETDDDRDASRKKPVVAETVADAAEHLRGGEDWPRWRGPRGDGTWRGPELPLSWPEDGPARKWRQPIGGGYAGVVVADNQVVIMDRVLEPNERERVLAFDAATGRKLWSYEYPVEYGELPYGNGPRAAPTMHGRHVFTLGAMGDLHCLNRESGRPVWSTHLVRDHGGRAPMWGFSASPLVHGDRLIVVAGAEPSGGILALERSTGRETWRSLPDAAGYAPPVLIKRQGREQFVCWMPDTVRGVDPSSGEILWTVPYKVTYGVSIATPIFAEGIVFVSGYWEGAKAIRLGPGRGEAKVVWEDTRNLRGLMSQPVYRDGRAYLLDKRHGLTCFEMATGTKLWDDENRMTPKGRNPQSSLVWLGDTDRVIVLNSDGDLILARLDAEGYHEQARANIIGPTWSHPAYAGACVFARSDEELVCCSLLATPDARGAGRKSNDFREPR